MQFRGRDIAPIPTIIRRFVALPFLMIGMILCFCSMTVGWGLESAKDFWNGFF